MARDYTKFDVTIDGTAYRQLAKVQAFRLIVSALLRKNVTPEAINQVLHWRMREWLYTLPGMLDKDGFITAAHESRQRDGRNFAEDEWFLDTSELVRVGGVTTAISRKIGESVPRACTDLLAAWPDAAITFTRASSG